MYKAFFMLSIAFIQQMDQMNSRNGCAVTTAP